MEHTDKLRAAWNAYVFARAGMANGAGMAVVSESDAFESLSGAINEHLDALLDEED